MITVVIPGEPVAQGRGRAMGFKRKDGTIGAYVFDPKKSKNWKATAQQFMRDAMGDRPPLDCAVDLVVVARFTCPKSQWKKRVPLPERPHAKRPDADNVLKAVKDAAKGVLWIDDAQVCDVRIIKFIAAQGAAPQVEIQCDIYEMKEVP